MSKSAVIHIRIDPEVLEQVKRAAANDGRTVSDWSARVLEAAAKQQQKPRGGVH